MNKLSDKQYASAIFSLAKQENIVEQITSDLESVEEKLAESPSFLKHLEYHKVSLEEKTKNLEEVFSDFISKKTYKIILLLVKNKQLNILKKIIARIKLLQKEDEKILEARIVVPYNLEENQISKIKSILAKKTGKQIIIHETVNKNIIGGMKIFLGDLIIDGSIQGKLEKLKQNIAMSLE